jgi:hypothetical protein
MTGEKKGKARVREANRRFHLSISSLSFLIKKKLIFVLRVKSGSKKRKKERRT